MTRTAGTPLERYTRTALLSGAVLLLVGIAAVGVGQATVGALPVVVGLALTILSIHSYGRLGPDEAPGAEDQGGAEALGKSRIGRGILAVAVAGAVTAGTSGASDGARILLLAVAAAWGVSQVHGGLKILRGGPSAPARRPPRPDRPPRRRRKP